MYQTNFSTGLFLDKSIKVCREIVRCRKVVCLPFQSLRITLVSVRNVEYAEKPFKNTPFVKILSK